MKAASETCAQDKRVPECNSAQEVVVPHAATPAVEFLDRRGGLCGDEPYTFARGKTE